LPEEVDKAEDLFFGQWLWHDGQQKGNSLEETVPTVWATHVMLSVHQEDGYQKQLYMTVLSTAVSEDSTLHILSGSKRVVSGLLWITDLFFCL
jgi:hypothetical protein